jgi:hypothetical protein
MLASSFMTARDVPLFCAPTKAIAAFSVHSERLLAPPFRKRRPMEVRLAARRIALTAAIKNLSSNSQTKLKFPICYPKRYPSCKYCNLENYLIRKTFIYNVLW